MDFISKLISIFCSIEDKSFVDRVLIFLSKNNCFKLSSWEDAFLSPILRKDSVYWFNKFELFSIWLTFDGSLLVSVIEGSFLLEIFQNILDTLVLLRIDEQMFW